MLTTTRVGSVGRLATLTPAPDLEPCGVPDVRHHRVQVPATSANLGPGFDAFGLAVDRYLAVRSLPRRPGEPRVRHLGDGAAGLPTGDDNLIWRSLVSFCDAWDLPVPDVALATTTQIPVERGMGSSSAAIVAGVVLGRALTDAEVGDRELVRLVDAIEGHPDNVAPALLGGVVACARGDDGELVIRRRNPAPHLRPVLLVPATRQGTDSARAVLSDSFDREELVTQAGRAGHVLAGLLGAWPVAPAASGDRLHEPTRLAMMPGTAAVVGQLRAAGVHVWLSGAGPSVAGVLTDGDRAALDTVRRVGADHGFALETCRFELSGALACPEDGCALAGSGGCVQCPGQRV